MSSTILYCEITNVNSIAGDNPESDDDCNVSMTLRADPGGHYGSPVASYTNTPSFDFRNITVGGAAFTDIKMKFINSIFSTSGTNIYPTGGTSPKFYMKLGSTYIVGPMEQGDDTLILDTAIENEKVDSGSTITSLAGMKMIVLVDPGDPNPTHQNTVAEFEQLCFPPFTLINTSSGLRKIKDLVRKDEIVTKNGNIPLSLCHKTGTPGKIDYVHLPKDCLTEGVPSYDVYVTPPHPFSLDYKSLPDEDIEYRLEPRQLVGRIPGVEKVQLDVDSYYNPVFDSSQIINVGNLKFFSHHPNTHPYILPKNLYLTKPYDKKITLTYLTLNELLEEKDKDQDIGEYIASLIRFD